jgi:DNA polymerase delta subunit 1
MAPRGPKTPAKRRGEARDRNVNAAVKIRYDEPTTGREPSACMARDVEHLVTTRRSRTPLRPGQVNANCVPPIACRNLTGNVLSLNFVQDIVFMALDIVDEAGGGRFHVWGVTEDGASVLVRITDFEPYFYVAVPENMSTGSPSGSGYNVQGEEGLCQLRMLFNRTIPRDSQICRIEPVHRRPILYFRPGSPGGDTYLKLVLTPGGNARKAGNAVLKSITSGNLKNHGYIWRDPTLYEYEVAPMQRLLADVPLSAGAWVYISSENVFMNESADRLSSCDIEVTVPWRNIVCLTPDATQLADQSWTPCSSLDVARAQDPPHLEKAMEAAKHGHIPGLRIMSMDVCLATYDGQSRTPVPSASDPIVAISCSISNLSEEEVSSGHGDMNLSLYNEEEELGLEGEDGGEATSLTPPITAGNPSKSKPIQKPPPSSNGQSEKGKKTVCFVLSAQTKVNETIPLETYDAVSQARVIFFSTESQLLLTWLSYVKTVDPDIIALFQVKDTLHAISQRFHALGLGGGGLFISRYNQGHSTPISIRRVTMYSAAWVRSQSRMSSTSNQETFKAEIDGRTVVDLLRHALSTCNLASFSLADLVQSLLGETIEVLGPGQLAAMCGLVSSPSLCRMDPVDANPALRAARYSKRRLEAVCSLLLRLSTIPEAI